MKKGLIGTIVFIGLSVAIGSLVTCLRPSQKIIVTTNRYTAPVSNVNISTQETTIPTTIINKRTPLTGIYDSSKKIIRGGSIPTQPIYFEVPADSRQPAGVVVVGQVSDGDAHTISSMPLVPKNGNYRVNFTYHPNGKRGSFSIYYKTADGNSFFLFWDYIDLEVTFTDGNAPA